MSYYKSEFENQVFADEYCGKPFDSMTLDELDAAKAQAETDIKGASYCDSMKDVRSTEEAAYRVLNSAIRELKKRNAEAAVGHAWASLFAQVTR